LNLGKRCEKMLENSTQCPNTVMPDSDYCVLHNEMIDTNSKLEDEIKELQKAEQVQGV